MRNLFVLLCLLVLAGPAWAFRVTGDIPANTIIGVLNASPTVEYTPRALEGAGTVSVYSVDDIAGGFTVANVTAQGDLLGQFTAADNNSTFRWVPTNKNVVALTVSGGAFGRHGKVDVTQLDYVSGGGSEGATINVNDYGATGGDDTDDAPAINNAIIAACAYSEGSRPKVRIPAGVYKSGSGIPAQFYSTINIPCDVEVVGDGRERTIIEPTVPTGSTIMFVCGGYDQHSNVDLCTQLDDVRISDIGFRDDAPYEHGQAVTTARVDNCLSCVGQEPEHGDAVTWTGGAGDIHDYIEDYYGAGQDLLAIDVTSGSLETDDVVTDGNYSLTTLSLIEGPTSEESHGLTTWDADVRLNRLGFYDIADEGLDVKHGSVVYADDIFGRGCSQAGSGGSTIAVNWQGELHLDNTLIYPGQRTVDGGGGAGISIEANRDDGASTDSPRFFGNNVTIVEDGTDLLNQIEALYALSSSQHDLTHAILTNSTLDVGLATDVTDSVSSSGSANSVYASISGSLLTGRAIAGVTDTHNLSLTGSTIICRNNTQGCLSSFQNATSNVIKGYGTADPLINWGNDGGTFIGNTVVAEQTCMFVASGNGVTIKGNTFNCGLNAVGLDYAIRFTGTSNDVYVADNYFEFVDGGGTQIIRSGLATSAVNQNDALVTTTGIIDATTNRGDLTP